MISTDEISLENFTTGDDIPITSTMPTSPMNPPNTTKSKSKKRKMEEEDTVTSKITVAISDVATAIRESSQVLIEFIYILYHYTFIFVFVIFFIVTINFFNRYSKDLVDLFHYYKYNIHTRLIIDGFCKNDKNRI